MKKPKRSHLHYKSTPEKMNNKDTKTESIGVLTHGQRVNKFVEAGIRTQEYRAEYYDYKPEEPIDPNRPLSKTRRWDYDMAEASQDLLEVEERLSQAKQEAAEIKARKAALEKEKTEVMSSKHINQDQSVAPETQE